jgi:cell filamentation protein
VGPTKAAIVIADAAAAQYRRLADAHHLVGLERDAFLPQLAEPWAELNVVHSFREGNTRTQFVFFSQLCKNAGYRLDPQAFMPGDPRRDEFVAARFYNQATTRTDRLERMLATAVTPLHETPAPDLAARRRRYPELFAETGTHAETPGAELGT